MTTVAVPSLYIREWIAILVIWVGFSLMTLLSGTGSIDDGTPAKPGHLWVEVEGSVRHPGAYQVPVGTTVQQALDLADPLPEASYRGLRRNSIVREGQLIRVKEQELMTVYLEGAVTLAGPIQVRIGTRLVDLVEIAPLKKEADISFLERKRRLKAGEHIVVPEKHNQGS